MTEDSVEAIIGWVRDRTGTRRGRRQESTAQTALVISCSMSGCEPGGELWPADASWDVLEVRTLGNQTRERYEDRTVLDSNIERLRAQHDITAVVVVGHTGCAVLEDAHERWVAPDTGVPAGVEARVGPLRSLVREGFEEGVLAKSMPRRTLRYRLVEYNVRRQVQFLRQSLPPSVTTAGYVHDQDGAYSSFPDKRYLVALDGETEPTRIRTRLPRDASIRTASLLS
jgi:carbonic anhydrase